jgi:2-C-methyl-D-erythritol 2,4-cyclodiphosphate synthase
LCDALLGALALGDIGKHFPDTDPAYQNADSRGLLRSVFDLIKTRGFVLGNADITIIAERPRVMNYSDLMRSALAEDMETDVSQVSIKATTTEKAGFLGREEGIAAQAIVLLMKAAS